MRKQFIALGEYIFMCVAEDHLYMGRSYFSQNSRNYVV